MKSNRNFWIVTMGRGILALIFGSVVMIFPDLAPAQIFFPRAVALPVLCLVAYGLFDSLIVLGSSLTACTPLAKTVLRIQGLLGVLVSLAMLVVVYEKVQLEWFFYLVAIQALCTGIAEFIVAHYAFARNESARDYAAAWIAVLAGSCYLIAWVFFDENLAALQIEWLICGYLAAFGFALAITAVRVLFSDYKFTSRLYTAEAR